MKKLCVVVAGVFGLAVRDRSRTHMAWGVTQLVFLGAWIAGLLLGK